MKQRAHVPLELYGSADQPNLVFDFLNNQVAGNGHKGRVESKRQSNGILVSTAVLW